MLSPEKIISNDKTKLTIVFDRDFVYTDPIHKISLSKKIAMLSFSKEIENIAIIEAFNFNPTAEQIIEYVSFQSLIKSCADSAEYINNELKTLNIQIAQSLKKDITEIVKMDFMKLKDAFMEFLKKDVLIKNIPEYNSNQKLKGFRQDFNQFVTDRNIYTHGLLCIEKSTMKYIIQYSDNTANKVYAYINHNILISYNNFYLEILNLIKAYRESRIK